MPFHEHRGRSLAKAATYRLVSLISDGIIVFAITREYSITLKVVIISNIVSILLYFIHERAWNKSAFGRLRKENLFK
jgi:uncharacterized membrane protein